MDDDDDDDADAMSDCRVGSAPPVSPAAEPSPSDDDLATAGRSLSSPRLLRPVGGRHLDVDRAQQQRGRRHADTPPPAPSSSEM